MGAWDGWNNSRPITGYRAEDVDLDGTVRYTGQNNDRDIILLNIGGVVPTTTRVEQVPGAHRSNTTPSPGTTLPAYRRLVKDAPAER